LRHQNLRHGISYYANGIIRDNELCCGSSVSCGQPLILDLPSMVSTNGTEIKAPE
jgi:hypothetical protein